MSRIILILFLILSLHGNAYAGEKSSQTKPLIVIDAGHGGQDPGTIGYNATREKDITLHYAKLLQENLNKSGAYRVILTRNSDKYLFLKERVEIARKAKAKLFISIHADSAPDSSARGLSVYTISEKASDKQSEALAAKENKADVIGGMDLSMTSKDVADILIDLTRRETMAKSNRFANLLVKNLSKLVNTLPHTHRSAGFAVLKAPEIASVLIEVGFLSNKKEEASLKNAAYQAKIMQGIVASVNAYFAGKK